MHSEVDVVVTGFLQAAGLAGDAVAGNYAAYLVELALPDYGMLKYSYSMVAAAAVQLTNRCARTVPLESSAYTSVRLPVFSTLILREWPHRSAASASVACSARSRSCCCVRNICFRPVI